MYRLINKLLEPIRNKLILMIAKAIITNVNDSENIQLVQVDLGNDEKIDSVERIQNFGLTSFPVNGGQAIVLSIGGEREHPVVIVVDGETHRPELNEGESAVYNAYDRIIKLKNGDIEIGASTFKKLINEEFQTMFNSHTHTYTSPVHPGPSIPTGTPSVTISNNEMTTILKAE